MPITRVKAELQGLPADVRVGMAAADVEGDALRSLSPVELQRLETYTHPDRRRSFALGRLAARTLLGEAMGASAAAVPLGVAAGGAPAVDGHPLYVSIAHAGRGADVAAVAAVGERRVGIDLELNTPRHPELLGRLLTPDEEGLPAALGVGEVEQASLVWTLKEAVLKGLGTGLRRGARSVVVEAPRAGLATAHDGDAEWSIRYERLARFWIAVAWKSVDSDR